MMTILIIVESPTKAKAIQSYAGPGHQVKASFGHVRDLPAKELGVEVEAGFKPHYIVTNRKAIQTLRKALESADSVILASDPDREGEAIAWHLAETLKKELRGKQVSRAVFHEITPAAVRAGLAATRPVDMALVDAQQARRILDRLVGYKLSPLLWKQIKRPWVRGKKPPALSAGRVQTVALRLVVEKDREFEAFIPVEFWTLDVALAAGPSTFKARLVQIDGKEPGTLKQAAVQAVMEDLKSAAWQVGSVERKQEKRYPYPPFTTSTLQQAASARLNWIPKKTMKVAQELFEGVTIAGEHIGLITYMRTDSLQVAAEAQQAARQTIQKYWPQALPDQPPVYKTKTANAQEAHEAIRPTDPASTPKLIREALSPDQAALYEIIWRRFIASQMKPALYSVTTLDVPAAGQSGRAYLFRCIGRSLLDPGFLAAYPVDEEDQDKESKLPDLQPGQALRFIRFYPEKHSTEPPKRYTQASLIRELEKRGLGRPSTYASIVEVLLERRYVEPNRGKSKVLVSTEVGRQVLAFLLIGFADIFDYGFTARMEEQLDEIAGGQVKWRSVLDEFWQKLGPRVE
jgi:DNA topoisomerase-1